MDWQPARLNLKAHSRTEGVTVSEEVRNRMARKIVRVILVEPEFMTVERYAAVGCDAEMFFQIHPEDLEPEYVRKTVCCEHQVLTD